jgi:apolipoprotein N-acyltransferase
MIINYNKIFSVEHVGMLVAGLLLTLAFAPFEYIVCAWISLWMLIDFNYQKPYSTVFKNTMIFGFCHFLSSLYWISISLTSQIATFWWLMPFAILGIPLVLTLYVATMMMLARKLFSRSLLLFSIGVAILWCIFEYLRGYFPFPFPWNFLGYTLISSSLTTPLIPLLGAHLGSFFVFTPVILFCIPHTKTKIACFGIMVSCIALLQANKEASSGGTQRVGVRIVQPNLQMHHFGRREQQHQAFETLVKLTSEPTQLDNLKMVVWPEGAYPFVFSGCLGRGEVTSALCTKRWNFSDGGRSHR